MNVGLVAGVGVVWLERCAGGSPKNEKKTQSRKREWQGGKKEKENRRRVYVLKFKVGALYRC